MTQQKTPLRRLRDYLGWHRFRFKRFLILVAISWRRREPYLLWQGRRHAPAHQDTPFVSVVIATYNRAAILTEITLPTVFNQTYPHFEIIIVGDGCTDDTEQRINQLADPRLRFINLSQRGKYPDDPKNRRLVAGTDPANTALDLARGDWIVHLDDDNQWTPDHIEVLLRHALKHDLELVWGKQRIEISPGEWIIEGSAAFGRFDIPHSTILFRSYLRAFKYDVNAWKVDLGGDRHLLRRMKIAGVHPGFVDRVVTIVPLRPGTTRQWDQAEDRDDR